MVGHLAAGLATPERTGLVEAANVGAFGSLWVLQFLLLDRVLFAARGDQDRSTGVSW